MKARWLRLVQRQALSYNIRSSRCDPQRWQTPVPRCQSSTNADHTVTIDPKVEENFFPAQPLSLLERRLLGKARLNGIDSLEKLKFEADIGHTKDIGSRMTDTPQHRQDLDLWLLLLQYNQHRHGAKGSKSIWRAMMFRGTPVTLESRNRNASDLVQSIIASAVEDIPFLKQLSLDCVHRNIFLDQLFVWVVGTLLVLEPKAAPTLTIMLKDACFQNKGDLVEIFRLACISDQEEAISRFCQVRSCLPDFKIYDVVLPIIWGTGRHLDAFMLQKYLLSRGDLPRTFDTLKPFIRHIAATEGDLDGFLRSLASVDVSFEAQIRRYHASQISRAWPSSSSAAATDKSEPEPRKPSDETIARALVTFPFEFVIQSLRFFGLIEVGPLAVRQIVRSSPDSQTLKQRFDKLKECEIDTGSSAYVRLIKRLATTGVYKIAKQLADSDMHHDEYEERDLQRRLLKQHYLNDEHQQVNNTLTILHQGHLNTNVQRQSVNLLLRSAIAAAEWQKILNLVHHICGQGYEVEQHTLDFLVQQSLQRQPLTPNSIDNTAFLIGVLQRLLAAGKPIQPATWLRPLTALGMQNRLDELEKLATWLADWYSSQSTHPRIFDRDLSKLFTPRLQSALISWSFTKASWKDPFSPNNDGTAVLSSPPGSFAPPWLRGARLLKKLRDEHDIYVPLYDLQRAFVLQVKQLYYADGHYRLVSDRRNAHRGYTVFSPRLYLRSWSDFWNEPVEADLEEKVLTDIQSGGSLGERRRSRGWSYQGLRRPLRVESQEIA